MSIQYLCKIAVPAPASIAKDSLKSAELYKHVDFGITFRAGQLAERIPYRASQDLLAPLDLRLYLCGITSLEKMKAAEQVEASFLLCLR